MLRKYLLIITVVLHISCSLGVPVDDGSIVSQHKQKRQVLNLRLPSSYSFPASPSYHQFNNVPQYNAPQPSRWSFDPADGGFNPMYQVNRNFRVGPYVDYDFKGNTVRNAGVRAEYRWKRSASDKTNSQVNQF